jgi:hypothetical protein
MNFLAILLRGIAFMPALVQGVEGMFGSKSGSEKKQAVLSFAGAALGMTDAVANQQIMDPDKFNSGLGKLIDGVVECMNASVWSKSKAK